MIIAGTGHRPDKLGGYDQQTFDRLVALAMAALEKKEPNIVITGMALGWDQALAVAAQRLGLPFHAYIPFSGQEERWFYASKKLYHTLLEAAHKTVVCSPGGYAAWKMQKRNQDMVDACDLVLALYDGSSGGTANCVAYAQEKGKPICNLWPSWTKYR